MSAGSPIHTNIIVEELDEIAKGFDCGFCGKSRCGCYVVIRDTPYTKALDTFACPWCATEWWDAADETDGLHPMYHPTPNFGLAGIVPDMRNNFHDDHTKSMWIRDALSWLVPLRIDEMSRRGGPTEDDVAQAKDYVRRQIENPLLVVDMMIPDSKRASKVASEQIAHLVTGIAVLAFQPGGVTFAGQVFDATTKVDLKDAENSAHEREERG